MEKSSFNFLLTFHKFDRKRICAGTEGGGRGGGTKEKSADRGNSCLRRKTSVEKPKKLILQRLITVSQNQVETTLRFVNIHNFSCCSIRNFVMAQISR